MPITLIGVPDASMPKVLENTAKLLGTTPEAITQAYNANVSKMQAAALAATADDCSVRWRDVRLIALAKSRGITLKELLELQQKDK